MQARQEMLVSQGVSELKREQEEDGSWGRFHSTDTKARKKIPTTARRASGTAGFPFTLNRYSATDSEDTSGSEGCHTQ